MPVVSTTEDLKPLETVSLEVIELSVVLTIVEFALFDGVSLDPVVVIKVDVFEVL